MQLWKNVQKIEDKRKFTCNISMEAKVLRAPEFQKPVNPTSVKGVIQCFKKLATKLASKNFEAQQ